MVVFRLVSILSLGVYWVNMLFRVGLLDRWYTRLLGPEK